MITAELTNYATGEAETTGTISTELGDKSALNQEIEINYDGGRLNVYVGSTLVFSTMYAGIDFRLSLKPC